MKNAEPEQLSSHCIRRGQGVVGIIDDFRNWLALSHCYVQGMRVCNHFGTMISISSFSLERILLISSDMVIFFSVASSE